MAHMLRKYTSNRGSALFMVITTMTALLISCMAMYFSMASARSSQYMVFNQTQANQTAMSISRLVLGEATNLQYDDKGEPQPSKLYEAIRALKKGESITTDANGFKSLDPGEETGLDDPNLGAYSVTITCLDVDANGYQVIDIMVITSVDGNRDSVHIKLDRFGDITKGEPLGEDGSGGDAELFAATGYVPNDAYISGGYYLTDVFYDTQYTYMNTFGGSGENRIGLNLSTGGDLMLGSDAMSVVHAASDKAISPADVAKIGPVTWAIRGNFYPNLGSDMGMRGGSQVLVGGDFVLNGTSLFAKKDDGYNGKEALGDHISIYVNGDFNYSNSQIKPNTWVFVNGNVTGVSGAPTTNTRLFVTGDASERAAKTAEMTSSIAVEEWPIDGAFAYGLNYTEAMALLGQKTQTIAYYKWDLSDNTKDGDHINIRLNASNQEWTEADGTKYDPYQSTFIIAHDKDTAFAKYIQGNGGNELGVIGDSFIIDSVWTHTDNNTGSEVILIDTGDNPDNIITIQLSDVTGNGEFAWFVDHDVNVKSWYPYEAEITSSRIMTGKPNRGTRMVALAGRGTVLIDIPKGLTYTDADAQFTGHIGWWLIEEEATTGYEGNGFEIKNLNGKEHLTFGGVDPQGQYSAEIVPYIHKTCYGIFEGEGGTGDGCVFKKKTSTLKCQECGGELTQVSCSIHGDVNKFCSACHPEKDSRRDWCKNHFDFEQFDKFYATLSDSNKLAVTGTDGKVVYPTTNFMLVSCDESAEMRFSKMKNGTQITNNCIFGFIYAPYMSYLAAGGAQAGGLIKLVGGMTVGDYDIQAINAYIGCYPDKMPMDLAGLGIGKNNGKIKGTSKSWKVVVGGYY